MSRPTAVPKLGDLDWALDAPCRGVGTEVFFPTAPNGYALNWEPARTICAPCTLRAVCKAYADANNVAVGMWGGKTPKERGWKDDQRRANDR